ncbi:hypothetical protein O3M35_006984 [Rhynocoris fuscipes]|uniref:Uncharacterized protein n=1 Tax=Rhynocoris fuscipes TaxID=488301 RepID=A0AAW1DN18_9HEMI
MKSVLLLFISITLLLHLSATNSHSEEVEHEDSESGSDELFLPDGICQLCGNDEKLQELIAEYANTLV